MIPNIDIDNLYSQPIQQEILALPTPPKKRKVWGDTYQLATFTLPELNTNHNIHRKWKITFKYREAPGQKVKSHTVFFGQGNDYVDHLDKEKRRRKISQMSNLSNPFHANYWSGVLLNKHDSINKGIQQLWQFLESKNKDRQKKRIKK